MLSVFLLNSAVLKLYKDLFTESFISSSSSDTVSERSWVLSASVLVFFFLCVCVLFLFLFLSFFLSSSSTYFLFDSVFTSSGFSYHSFFLFCRPVFSWGVVHSRHSEQNPHNQIKLPFYLSFVLVLQSFFFPLSLFTLSFLHKCILSPCFKFSPVLKQPGGYPFGL